MSTLDDLFGDGARDDDGRPVRASHGTTQRLDEMLGGRRPTKRNAPWTTDREDLIEMVSKEVTGNSDLSMPTHPAMRRRRRPVDLVGALLVTMAILALATTGLVGGMQAASASPADDALRVLDADERTIESSTVALSVARRNLIDTIGAAELEADILQRRLEDAKAAPKLDDVPVGNADDADGAGSVEIADPDALEEVFALINAYRAALRELEPPPLPTAYDRPSVNQSSLSEVATAIDAAQLHLETIDATSAQVRTASIELEKLETGLTNGLKRFATSFVTASERVVAKYAVASQRYRDEVRQAAEALALSDLRTEAGAEVLASYRNAVIALEKNQTETLREQDRARMLREQQAREQQERERRQQWQPAPRPAEPDPVETASPAEPDSGSTGAPTAPAEPPEEGDSTRVDEVG